MERALGAFCCCHFGFIVHAEVEAAAAKVEPHVGVALLLADHGLVDFQRLWVLPQVEIAVTAPVFCLGNGLARAFAELRAQSDGTSDRTLATASETWQCEAIMAATWQSVQCVLFLFFLRLFGVVSLAAVFFIQLNAQ